MLYMCEGGRAHQLNQYKASFGTVDQRGELLARMSARYVPMHDDRKVWQKP